MRASANHRIQLVAPLAVALLLTVWVSRCAKGEVDLSSPRESYSTFVRAVKTGDLTKAKECWSFHDDDCAGALDIYIGYWISLRRLNSLVAARFGASGLGKLGGWESHQVSDAALSLTLQRVLDGCETRVGSKARLEIIWHERDGFPNAAFMYSADPIHFLRKNDKWVIDANKMTGLKRSRDFTASAFGKMLQAQLEAIRRLIGMLERGEVQTEEVLGARVEGELRALVEAFDRARH